jgi:transposase-like protein
MKKSRYSEEQVAYALRLAESGTPVADVCRQTGIAEATFYLWKKKFGSLGVPEVRELRQMREENARLKRLVADALTGQSVVDALDALARRRPLPKAITVDHGTEFTSKALDEWAYQRGVALNFIRPGKPVENASIESFNGRVRDECLNVYSFESIAHAQAVITAWRDDYNHRRPHGALGHLTPSEYATLRQQPTSEAAPLQSAPVW